MTRQEIMRVLGIRHHWAELYGKLHLVMGDLDTLKQTARD
jgi:hypothetical protein